jgi:hypothetical protein
MRCECLACGTQFKNSLAFADHLCEHAAPQPLVRKTVKTRLTRMSFDRLLQKDNTEIQESALA